MYKVIGADGKEYGPVDAAQIRRWIAEGRLNAQSRVRLEGGSADWQPLAQFSEFGPALSVRVAGSPPATPVVVKVFAILNIVLGGLGLLCSPLSFASIPAALRIVGDTTVMRTWLIFSTVTGVIGAVILLVSGIGLWRLKAWARKLAVIYAWVGILLSIPRVAVIAAAFAGQMQPADPGVIGGFIGGLLSCLIWIAYYVLLIVFLGSRSVRQAFGETPCVKSTEAKE